MIPGSAGPVPEAGPPALRVTCRGTRGSIPSPGPETVRYGGNTSCVEVRLADDRCLILDAGTGIRGLGRRLVAEAVSTRTELFLTHLHWDHIQGLPFFAPLYHAEARVRIHGARQDGADIGTLLAAQMAPVHFPVPYDALAARIEFAHLQPEPWTAEGVEVTAMRVRHPASTYGYRIRAGGATLAYIPDNELAGGEYPVDDDGWYDDLARFLDGADLLLHDAMYTDAEYAERVGWGHSTFRQAIELAETAGVRRLRFFHHAPERSDAELDGILSALRGDLERRGSALEIGIAAEGVELPIEVGAH